MTIGTFYEEENPMEVSPEERYSAVIASLKSVQDYFERDQFDSDLLKPRGFTRYFLDRIERVKIARTLPRGYMRKFMECYAKSVETLKSLDGALADLGLVVQDAAFTKLTDERFKKDETHYGTGEMWGPALITPGKVPIYRARLLRDSTGDIRKNKLEIMDWITFLKDPWDDLAEGRDISLEKKTYESSRQIYGIAALVQQAEVDIRERFNDLIRDFKELRI